MTFQNYVCWDTALLPRVMNPDAFQMDDHLFLATHHPVKVKRVERTSRTGAGVVWSQEKFRDAFLSEGGDYLLAAVLGYTGSGKSHLVRWLKLNIPPEAQRHIVLIPRHGNNLKRVIEQILSGMEGPAFESFRTRLRNAAEQLSSPEANRQKFLNSLSVQVGSPVPLTEVQLVGLDASQKRDAQEERDYLVEFLPPFLLDDNVRRELLRESGIVDELVNHVIGQSSLQGRDFKREFTLDEFNVHEWRIAPDAITARAREFYSDLRGSEALRRSAVAWMNQNLERVFGEMLNLGGEDLRALMNEVRAALHEQNKELFLFIEDLSNLQGIDNALLEALLVRPNDPSQQRQLCPLRAVVAVTTGYYEGLPENVRDRVGLTVTLDVERTASGQGQISASELADFAGRYLNAVRKFLPPGTFAQWHEASQVAAREGATAPSLPSGCTPCPFRERCHSGFAAVNNGKTAAENLGLYPFTPSALKRMYERIGEYTHFNPRAFIYHVLGRTLNDAAPEMDEGRFPDPVTFSRFGPGTMKPEEQSALRGAVPPGKFEQVRTVLELWGNPSDWPDPAIVVEAFTLPSALPVSKPPTVPGPGATLPDTGAVPPPPPPTDTALQRFLDELDAWSNNAVMSPQLAQALREHLYAAIDAAIDWDTEGWVRSVYSGEAKPFRRNSIALERQPTMAGKAPVQVRLPMQGDDILDLTLTFKGLLLYAHHGRWEFPDGLDRMVRYAELVERCAADVLRQLRQLSSEMEAFDPVPAVVELLAVGAALVGQPKASQTSDEEEVNALFLNWKEECKPVNHANRGAAWKELLRAFESEGDKLVDILKSRAGLTKGGYLALQMLDTAAFAKTLRDVRNKWQLSASIPETIRADYAPIQRVRRVVDAKLALAVEEEAERLSDYRATVKRYIAPETSAPEVVKAVRRLGDLAGEAAVKPTGPWNALEAPMTDFSNARFETFLRSLEVMEGPDAKAGITRLPFVGRGDFANPMARGAAFFQSAETFLTALNNRLDSELTPNAGGSPDELQRDLTDGLQDLCAMTADFAGVVPRLEEANGAAEVQNTGEFNGVTGGVVHG